eukprot:TRINITY_DN9105_c0_g1_i3.p1 TRINITY_DN9105_c0_g1~~TRINITY_DN9105_c0_g1_i3.p1  ORF type:complete len:305 (-),score=60.37 TRINITY_DN9105_c0_g1_i3:165-1040(-)
MHDALSAIQLLVYSGLPTKSFGKLSTDCFTGTEGVKWFETNLSLLSDQAILLLQAIHSAGYIINVEDPFKNFGDSLDCHFVPVYHKLMNFMSITDLYQKHRFTSTKPKPKRGEGLHSPESKSPMTPMSERQKFDTCPSLGSPKIPSKSHRSRVLQNSVSYKKPFKPAASRLLPDIWKKESSDDEDDELNFDFNEERLAEFFSHARYYSSQVERDHEVMMYIFRRYHNDRDGIHDSFDTTSEITPRVLPSVGTVTSIRAVKSHVVIVVSDEGNKKRSISLRLKEPLLGLCNN